MSQIYLITDGAVLWLECFRDRPAAVIGESFGPPVEAGTKWDDLAAAVAAHLAEHGCGQETEDDQETGPSSPR